MPADQAVANSTYARSPDRLSPPHTGTTSTTSTGESRTGVVPTTDRTLLEHSLRYHPLTHPLTLNLTLDFMQNLIYFSMKFQTLPYKMVICYCKVLQKENRPPQIHPSVGALSLECKILPWNSPPVTQVTHKVGPRFIPRRLHSDYMDYHAWNIKIHNHRVYSF